MLCGASYEPFGGLYSQFPGMESSRNECSLGRKTSLDRLAQDPQAYIVTFQVQLAAESPAREFAQFPP